MTNELKKWGQVTAELTSALSWALDLIDMYDQRLAEIDGPELVYSLMHLTGKSKARETLQIAQAALKEGE